MDQVAEATTKFEELKNTISKRNEEFKELYSTIGKERVEMDSLNESVTELQSTLVAWGQRNRESMDEVTDIRKELASLAKDLKSKDLTKDVHDISDRIGELASRVDALQQQERQMEELQQQLVDFDQNLKELVRKAVMATISKQEFEAELEKIETKGKPRKKKPISTEPSVPDMRAKMRQLRDSLKSEAKDKSILGTFTKFEKKIISADSDDQKNTLWGGLTTEISIPLKVSIDNARKKIGEQKAAGADTSKLNLLVAKADIGMVSFETAVAMRNLVKVKDVVQKLSELKSQMDAAT